MLKIGVLLGDDIWLEVVPEAVKVMKAAAAKTGLQVEWQDLPIGRKGHESHGHSMPQVTVDLHEMGGDSQYYFPPAAAPNTVHTTPQQRDWMQGKTIVRDADERAESLELRLKYVARFEKLLRRPQAAR